jgi:predicted ATPase
MLVKEFIGRSIYGHLNFNIKFNRDISFLVGSNGSGKTTALRMMNALVTPNFKDLLTIPFLEISLCIEEKNKDLYIRAHKVGDEIQLQVSGISDALLLPTLDLNDYSFYNHRTDKINEMVNDVVRRFQSHPVMKAISEISTPIFLGLERRSEDNLDISADYFFDRPRGIVVNNSKQRKIIPGSLGMGLMETELLVQNSYRRLRELEERQLSRMRDSILMSVFQYNNVEFDFKDSAYAINNWKEKQGLLQRQNEIKTAIANIGLKNKAIIQSVDDFFEKMSALFEKLSTMDKGLSVEWLLNKAQVDRISKIVEIIDEHKSKQDSLFKPINDFISTVNSFYQDSNKSIKLDTVGQIVVKRPDGKECSIEGLSSGERQLLVIFAHVYFSKNDKRTTFIIDEPELSLHLRWQERFTDTIKTFENGGQFILATHSPEIVGKNKNKVVQCR